MNNPQKSPLAYMCILLMTGAFLLFSLPMDLAMDSASANTFPIQTVLLATKKSSPPLYASANTPSADIGVAKPTMPDTHAKALGNVESITPELPEDLTKAYITLGILVLAAISFFANKIHPAATAMLVACIISGLGLISPKEAFINFGQINVVTFMGFFIIGEACFATGFANLVGDFVTQRSKGNVTLLIVLILLCFGLLSSILSNAGVVAMALPMVLGISQKSKINPGKLLIPLTYAASVGGTITLIGTPPNLITNAAIEEFTGTFPIQPFGMFDWAIVGVPFLLCTIIYFALIGAKKLPDTFPSEDNLADSAERNKRELRKNKMPHCLTILGGVLLCMVFGFLPLVTAAMLGAILTILTGCITMREAFRGIDWTTIFIMAGMIGFGTAMEQTGAALLVATKIVEMVSNPYALLAAIVLIASILTNLMSNAGSAALLAPLCLKLALQASISPLPILMGLAMGISCCFVSPIGTPSNTMVFGAGNYSFLDFVKAGWPLQLIGFVLIMVIVPLAWPFHP